MLQLSVVTSTYSKSRLLATRLISLFEYLWRQAILTYGYWCLGYSTINVNPHPPPHTHILLNLSLSVAEPNELRYILLFLTIDRCLHNKLGAIEVF